jgi:hypothetical protein
MLQITSPSLSASASWAWSRGLVLPLTIELSGRTNGMPGCGCSARGNRVQMPRAARAPKPRSIAGAGRVFTFTARMDYFKISMF